MHVVIAFLVGFLVGAVLGYVFRAKISAAETYASSEIGNIGKKL